MRGAPVRWEQRPGPVTQPPDLCPGLLTATYRAMAGSDHEGQSFHGHTSAAYEVNYLRSDTVDIHEHSGHPYRFFALLFCKQCFCLRQHA